MISPDLNRLAQMQPNQKARFVAVSLEEGLEARRRYNWQVQRPSTSSCAESSIPAASVCEAASRSLVVDIYRSGGIESTRRRHVGHPFQLGQEVLHHDLVFAVFH